MEQGNNIKNQFDEVKEEMKTLFSGSSSDKYLHKKDNKVHPLTQPDAYNNIRLWNNLASTSYIDEEIHNLRAALTQSYEAFVAARNTLDSISFIGIDSRIKDLHLPLNDTQIENTVKDRPVKECLQELTDVMKGHLSNHAEDFGGIPELQTFFKVCSQLKFCVKNLLSQTKHFEELDRRLDSAIRESECNIENISKSMNEKR